MILAMTSAKARPSKRGEVLQTLLSLLGSIRKEKGCRACHSYFNLEDENHFILVEEWTSRTDFKNHIGTEEFRVLLGALTVLCEPQETRMNLLSVDQSHKAMSETVRDLLGKD